MPKTCAPTIRSAITRYEQAGLSAKDRDRDGVFDFEDLCPDEPRASIPIRSRRAAPAATAIAMVCWMPEDLCPDEPQGPSPIRTAAAAR